MEYKKLKFKYNEPVTVKLLFDNPQEKEGEHGKFYSWGVEIDGEAYLMNPSKKLVDMIKESGAKKDDKVTITKKQFEDLEDGKLKSYFEIDGQAPFTGGEFKGQLPIVSDTNEVSIPIKKEALSSKDKLILKQVALKSSVQITGDVKTSIEVAQEFYNWLLNE